MFLKHTYWVQEQPHTPIYPLDVLSAVFTQVRRLFSLPGMYFLHERSCEAEKQSEPSLMDKGNEIWKLGGRENKYSSGRRLEESAAGGGVRLSKFLCILFFSCRYGSPFCFPVQSHSLYNAFRTSVQYFFFHAWLVDILVVNAQGCWENESLLHFRTRVAICLCAVGFFFPMCYFSLF